MNLEYTAELARLSKLDGYAVRERSNVIMQNIVLYQAEQDNNLAEITMGVVDSVRNSDEHKHTGTTVADNIAIRIVDTNFFKTCSIHGNVVSSYIMLAVSINNIKLCV